MGYFFAVAVGYLLGSSNMAFYLSKLKNIDLRKRGSGNLGTCNAWTELGWVSSVLVFLHDAGKAVIAVLLTRWLFPDDLYASNVAGLFAILGHIYPFYLKFKGGKGHAAYIGMAFAVNWWVALIATPFCIAIWLISDYIAGLILATIVLFPLILFCAQQWQAGIIALITTAFVFYRCLENLQRIKNGTEAKFFESIRGKHTTDSDEQSETSKPDNH